MKCLFSKVISCMLLVLSLFVSIDISQAYPLLEGSFAINIWDGKYTDPLGPFMADEQVPILATVKNISTYQTIFICDGICIGDINTYSLGGLATVPDGYAFVFGDGKNPFGAEVVGDLLPGQEKTFVFGVYTPKDNLMLGWYSFYNQLQIFDATPERNFLSGPQFGGRWEVVAPIPEPVIETVDTNLGYGPQCCYTSIAVDSADNAHISYQKWIGGITLKYATNSLGTWSTEAADTTTHRTGYFSSIAVSPSGTVHISEYDTDPNDLVHVWKSEGTWNREIVDGQGNINELGWYSSIALDSSGNLHIGYVDRDLRLLKYATNSSGAWQISTIDEAVRGNTSLTIGPSDSIHIAYLDAEQRLHYATNASGEWQAEVVDDYASTDYGVSMSMDHFGELHISYYDAVAGDLKHARGTFGSWNLEVIDSDGDVGAYSSSAIDSLGKIHISYYDATNQDLKYAVGHWGSWLTKTLDSLGDVGYFTSIKTDSKDNVHISYYDMSNGALKYASIGVDTTPDPFVFIDQTGVALSTPIISNSITVSGINAPTPISVVGGEYSVNEEAFTSAAGTVVNGDTVRLRLISSTSYSTTTTATVTIGGVDGAFSVTTMAPPDTEPPVISFEGTCPETGLLNSAAQVIVLVTDVGSGVAFQSVPNGLHVLDTSTVGWNTFTVTATDNAGLSATKSCTYRVIYDFVGAGGFHPPVNNPPVLNIAKAGSSVPVKWQLPNGMGGFITDLSVVTSIKVRQADCGSLSTGVTDPVEAVATGGTVLRYDFEANQFIYNWQTSKSWAGLCYTLTLSLNDGSQYPVNFKLR